MAVYLVQHGIAEKKPDLTKRLSPEGIEITEFMAELVKTKKIDVKGIVHSGKERAFETAQIFDKHLQTKSGVKELKGLNPLDPPEVFARDISINENIMVVGHLPFLEKLVSYLILEKIDPVLIKFQNSCIVCLEKEDGNWFIKWSLMPVVD